MYKTSSQGALPPVFITTQNSGVIHRVGTGSPPASGTIGAANRMVYCPITLTHGVVVYRHFWLNGGTVGTDNVNTAVYDTSFNRISLGSSTLSAGANVCQFDNVTDYYLGPGAYYLTLWLSGNTATVFRVAALANGAGVYYETNASGPQATGTPAAPGTQLPVIPLVGLALRATDP